MKFISRHPYLTLALLTVGACFVFGPARTGAWIHVHAVWAIAGTWRFAVSLVGVS